MCHLHNHADLTKKRKKTQGEQKGSRGITVRITQMQTTWQRQHALMPVTAMATAPSCAAFAPSLPLPFYVLRCPFFSFFFFFSKWDHKYTTSSSERHARRYFPIQCHFFRLDCQSFASALVSPDFILEQRAEHKGQKCKVIFLCLGIFMCFIDYSLSQSTHKQHIVHTAPLCVLKMCIQMNILVAQQ